jgi:hypothetical protein
MKKPIYLMLSVAMLALGTSCKKDDDDNSPGRTDCLAEQMTMTETEVEDFPNSHTVFITFDAKNTSSKNFDIANGSKIIVANVKVTTTDGSVYESKNMPFITDLSAGATASVLVNADYGANKTFKSYSLELSCR